MGHYVGDLRKRINGVVYSGGCGTRGVITVIAKEFGFHTIQRLGVGWKGCDSR